MLEEIEEVLVTEKDIQEKVRELGEAISCDYAGKDPILVIILKGATLFAADLVRAITIPVSLDFMAISSYGLAKESSGIVRTVKDLDESITDRHVIVVEDIIDTGLTVTYLLNILRARRPKSLEVCALLDKPSRRLVDVPLKYVGFRIPDRFVVGYGLDFSQRYRNLPFVCVLKPEAYRAS